ncbi:MAG: hypothetical protein WB626_03450 [Bacteroidota bacterium]
MTTKAYVSCAAAFLLAASACFSQGETAVPFLLVTPSAEAGGTADAFAGIRTSDPLGPVLNPAHLGLQAGRQWFSFGYNRVNWLPQLQHSDLYLRTYAFNAGVNLRTLDEGLPPISIGVGFSRIFLNLGEFVRTSSSGPEPIETFEAWESSNQLSVGAGVDWWIRAAAGFTSRSVTSRIGLPGEEWPGSMAVPEGKAALHDIGFLAEIPLLRLASEAAGRPIEIMPSFVPYLDWSLGVAKNNLGQESITYIDPAQADPLPRYGRAGMGVDVGLCWRKGGMDWKVVSFRWSTEAGDLLLRRYGELRDSAGTIIRPAGWEYKEGLGAIRFYDEVVRGHTNPETEKRKGWELTLLEIFSLRGGRFEEDPQRGNRRYNTAGWGIRLGGVVKLLAMLEVPMDAEGIGGFLLQHADVQFDYGALDTEDGSSPLDRTRWGGLRVAVWN